jgi:hypothetical protein
LSAIGCKVGNGLATGANKVFVARSDDDALSLGVEPAFWIPTVVPSDVSTGTIAWSGHHLLNVWTPGGELVNPSDHPGLLAYLQAHHAQLARRYVARARPEAWYRSLDRPQPGLLKTPKLLIADIQKAPRFALDEGHFYPRNGVYYVLSEHWPLSALRLVLESGLAHLFIAAASTTVRGGGFRCQAQYLRSIPLRPWRELAVPLRRALMAAAAAPTPRPDLLARIFELTPDEQQVIAAAAEVDG